MRPFDEPAYAHAQRLVDVGGRRLNLYCTGHGSPAVVLEAGLGTSTTIAWRYLQPLVARTHRVCSYDRAGWGFSDPGPQPRTSGAIASDLHALLGAAQLRPPYVLVAHSFGAYAARLFADRFPAETAGLVFIDPSEEDFDARAAGIYGPHNGGGDDEEAMRMQRCRAASHAGQLRRGSTLYAGCMRAWPPTASATPSLSRALGEQRTRAAQWDAFASETEHFSGASAAEVRRARANYGDVPVAVLTAGSEDWSGEGVSRRQESQLRALWIGIHEELARRSRRGTHEIVAGAGHEIQVDRPEAVARAIDAVIAAQPARSQVFFMPVVNDLLVPQPARRGGL